MSGTKRNWNVYEDRGSHTAIIVTSKTLGIHEVLVDTSDVPRLKGITWCVQKTKTPDRFYAVGYIGTSRSDSRVIRMHQLLAGSAIDVDHRNFNGLDNRRFNLRKLTRSANMIHRKGPRTDNTSGYLGVSWDKARKKWFAKGPTVDGKQKSLGRFDKIEDAILAVRTARAAVEASL